jgi:hypothetical protein
MNWREFFGLLPKRVEDCPNCGSGRTGIVLYHSGDDLSDIRRAGNRGYYVEHIYPNEELLYDRFCLDCGYRWMHEEMERAGHLTYESERPEIDTEKHTKLGWKMVRIRREKEKLAHPKE